MSSMKSFYHFSVLVTDGNGRRCAAKNFKLPFLPSSSLREALAVLGTKIVDGGSSISESCFFDSLTSVTTHDGCNLLEFTDYS